MMAKSRSLAMAAALVALGIGAAEAGEIRSPVAVVASSPVAESGSEYSIDQSGLSQGFDSGESDFDEYIASDPLHDIQSDTRWLTKKSLPGTIDYDLGAEYVVEQVALWNYDGSSIAIENIALYAAGDEDFSDATQIGSFAATQGDGDPRNAVAQVFDLAPSVTRYVRLEVTSTYGNKISGFGEIAFNTRSASASCIRSPSAVVASSLAADSDPVHSIDQSGLSQGFDSGESDFDEYIASDPLHDIQSDTRWLTKKSLPGTIDYDLGAEYVIDQMALWNYDGSNIAIENIALYAAGDEDFSDATQIGSFAATQGDGDPRNAVAQVFDLAPSVTRYVRLEVTSTYGNNTSGFGEIAFRSECGD